MRDKYIYKITNLNELKKAKLTGIYLGSEKDIQDGFIHFSDETQVEETLKKYYLNQKDLILLKVDISKLKDLIWEKATNGKMFPHLYSSLDLSNIVDEHIIEQSYQGIFEIPQIFFK